MKIGGLLQTGFEKEGRGKRIFERIEERDGHGFPGKYISRREV